VVLVLGVLVLPELVQGRVHSLVEAGEEVLEDLFGGLLLLGVRRGGPGRVVVATAAGTTAAASAPATAVARRRLLGGELVEALGSALELVGHHGQGLLLGGLNCGRLAAAGGPVLVHEDAAVLAPAAALDSDTAGGARRRGDTDTPQDLLDEGGRLVGVVDGVLKTMVHVGHVEGRALDGLADGVDDIVHVLVHPGGVDTLGFEVVDGAQHVFGDEVLRLLTRQADTLGRL